MPLNFIAAPRRRKPVDIVAYVGQFGMRFDALTPEQVAMFIAARQAAQYVESLKIPVATRRQPTAAAAPVQQETDQVLRRTSHRHAYRETNMPDDEMDVGTVAGARDLPRLLPGQWLLEEVQPTVFYHKLAQRELLMPVWQRPSRGWRSSPDNAQASRLADEDGNPETRRPHAYVLLDVSRSMNDLDRRGTVARGLALAFVLQGRRARCRLNLRPFAGDVGELSTGVDDEGLRAITRRIIGLPNDGQTRIQAALATAAADVRDAGPSRRADLMLISDGISRLTEKPISHERLHTFLLGDLVDEDSMASSVAKLHDWSQSYHRLAVPEFDRLLTPIADDLRATARLLQAALDRFQADPSRENAAALGRLRAITVFLRDQFRRHQGEQWPASDEARALDRLLARVPAAEHASDVDGIAPPPEFASGPGPARGRARRSRRRRKDAAHRARKPGAYVLKAPRGSSRVFAPGLLAHVVQFMKRTLRHLRSLASRVPRIVTRGRRF